MRQSSLVTRRVRARLGKMSFFGFSAAHVVATMLPPVIAPARPCDVSDNRARSRTNQSACDRRARRSAGETTDNRAAAATH